jgi:hypothetical protein
VTVEFFIQANNNQLVAAKVAKFALETRGGAAAHGIPVTIMNVDEMPLFAGFSNVPYLCAGGMTRYDRRHVQSFTLSRFLPPEIMSFSGRALVIDPDVLALSDVGELLSFDFVGNAIAACRRDRGWESSVMLLDCSKLLHWRLESILDQLRNSKVDYLDLMWLRNEPNVLELPGSWNSHDAIGSDTRMLHMTRMSTQPWKTGLRVGSTRADVPPFLGVIPRAALRRLVGRPEPRFARHPDADVEHTFMTLFKEAVRAGAIMEAEIADAVAHERIRPDIWEHIA